MRRWLVGGLRSVVSEANETNKLATDRYMRCYRYFILYQLFLLLYFLVAQYQANTIDIWKQSILMYH